MNWDAIGAIAEFGGTIAVLITLIYISIQFRNANKQRELDALRHTRDALNQFHDLFTQSTENASIVNRGRKSLSDLDEDEYTVFEHIHLSMLNTIESWYQQVDATSPLGAYRDEQMENIAGAINVYIDHPGMHDFWSKVKHLFVSIQQLVEDNISHGE